jgi:hypothetical protein
MQTRDVVGLQLEDAIGQAERHGECTSDRSPPFQRVYERRVHRVMGCVRVAYYRIRN